MAGPGRNPDKRPAPPPPADDGGGQGSNPDRPRTRTRTDDNSNNASPGSRTNFVWRYTHWTINPTRTGRITNFFPRIIDLWMTFAMLVLQSPAASAGLEQGDLAGHEHFHGTSWAFVPWKLEDMKIYLRNLFNLHFSHDPSTINVKITHADAKTGLGSPLGLAWYPLKNINGDVDQHGKFAVYGWSDEELKEAYIERLAKGKGSAKHKVMLTPRDCFSKMASFYDIRMCGRDLPGSDDGVYVLETMLQSGVYIPSAEWAVQKVEMMRFQSLWNVTRSIMERGNDMRVNSLDVVRGFFAPGDYSFAYIADHNLTEQNPARQPHPTPQHGPQTHHHDRPWHPYRFSIPDIPIPNFHSTRPTPGGQPTPPPPQSAERTTVPPPPTRSDGAGPSGTATPHPLADELAGQPDDIYDSD